MPKHKNPIINANQFPPVPKNGINGPGVVHVNPKAGVGIQLKITVTVYPTKMLITGVKTNGIAKIGFKTIGKPKINGSLILNKPGTRANFAISR